MKITIGTQELDLATPAVMAILNVTPDSFFEGSRNFDEEKARGRVREIREHGVSLIDIGGYSTRPGAPEITPEEEFRRLDLGFSVVRAEFPNAIVSIDTFRADVADKILERHGACIINDISAGELDPKMPEVAAKWGVPYLIMHMRGTPADMQRHTGYADIAAEVADYLTGRADEFRERYGIRDIILDPGFGFAKTTRENYELLAGMHRLSERGYPVLAGISRKSMIYKVLDKTPAGSLAGTTALNWECLRQGANILRVHDVAEAVDTVRLFDYYKENLKSV